MAVLRGLSQQVESLQVSVEAYKPPVFESEAGLVRCSQTL
jgi:hypothetical protein